MQEKKKVQVKKRVEGMKMNIKKLSEKDGIARFLVKEADTAFMNAFRRTVMNNVPVLAVDEISIYENTSIFFDELLGNRLGMLPIKTDVKGYKKKDKVKLTLEKEGPCTVYSSDIKCSDPKVEIACKNVPIVKLDEKQKIKVEMEAVMGTGKKHSKWQAALVSYSNLPKIELKDKKASLKEVLKACPKGILKTERNKIAFIDPYKCDLCKACEEAGELKLTYEPNAFILSVESFGSLTVKEIFWEAVKSLGEKNKQFKEAVKKIK